MKKPSIKFKRVGLLGFAKRAFLPLFLISLLLTTVLIPLVNPREVRAENEDQLCVPRYSDLGGDKWETGAFTFKFISRFEIKVRYNQTGNCQRPSDLSSRFLHNDGTEFAPLAEQTLFFPPPAALALLNGGRPLYTAALNSTDLDESLIEVPRWAPSQVAGWELYRNRQAGTIDSIFNDAEYSIGIEEDELDGSATCSGRNSNFHLINEDNDGDPVKWRCDDDGRNERGAQISSHLQDKNKFNIVFKVNGDATEISSLLGGSAETFNFTLCQATGRYKNDGCNGNVEIQGLTQEQARNIGNGTRLVDFTGADIGNFQAVVAGSQNEAQVGGGDGGGGGGNGENGPPSCEEENPGISLSWFICSVLNFLDDTVTGLNRAVGDLLEVPPEYYTDDRLQEAWSYFRNIASFLLIIVGLVMIIGQAITKG